MSSTLGMAGSEKVKNGFKFRVLLMDSRSTAVTTQYDTRMDHEQWAELPVVLSRGGRVSTVLSWP